MKQLNSSLLESNSLILNEEVTILMQIVSFINSYVLPTILSYLLIPAILLSLINNSLIIIIFSSSKQISTRITKSVRVYYIAMAISDINDTISCHLRYFLGNNYKDTFVLSR